MVVGADRRVAGQHEREQRGRDSGERDDRERRAASDVRCAGSRPSALAGVRDELRAGRVAPSGSFASALVMTSSSPGGAERRLLEVGEEDGGLGRSRERRRAGQALVEEARERVLVGAAVDLLALDLLRSDVRRRAEREAGVEAGRLLGEPPREPEVRQVDMIALDRGARSTA